MFPLLSSFACIRDGYSRSDTYTQNVVLSLSLFLNTLCASHNPPTLHTTPLNMLYHYGYSATLNGANRRRRLELREQITRSRLVPVAI